MAEQKEEQIEMDPNYKQMLDDVFDAFTMLSGGAIVNLMHVQGDVTRWSPAGVELFGLPGEYIRNGSMDWGDYVHPEDKKRYMDVMAPLITGERQTYDLTYRVRTKSGEYGNFRVIGAVLRDANGDSSLIGGVLINQGLTENVDPVTVLPNKNAYQEDLGKLLRSGRRALTLLSGISGLSEINQVYGYTYGNRILQETAWLIQETVKERGTVYRMDDATFAFLTETAERDEVAAIYDTLRIKLQRGISIDGVRNILTANGGLISAQGEDVDASTVYTCVKYAYNDSRHRKHGELVDFNGSINYEETDSLEKINVIRDSIMEDCKGFKLYYRPIIKSEDERAMGVEERVVWEGEPYGRVDAEAFMGILENDFVFEELGDWILHQAMNDGKKMVEKDPEFTVSINIASVQMKDDYFIDSVKACLDETGFPPENLHLRLTSDCRLVEYDRAEEVIRRLHEMKIRVVMDDFGTGFDSIGFMKRMKVDVVCFNKELTKGLEDSEEDRNTLEYLIKMVRVRGVRVNVAGVDSEEMRRIIRALPATSMQGAYYDGALPYDTLIEKYF